MKFEKVHTGFFCTCHNIENKKSIRLYFRIILNYGIISNLFGDL